MVCGVKQYKHCAIFDSAAHRLNESFARSNAFYVIEGPRSVEALKDFLDEFFVFA